MKHLIPSLLAVLLVGCAQSVDRVSHGTVRLLEQHSVAADPADFDKGQVRPRFRWQIRPGTVVRASMSTELGIPCLEGKINGEETPLILDTGNAFPVLLDAGSAMDVGLHTLRGMSAKGTGIGGNVDVMLGQFESLEMGGHRLLGRGVAGIFLHSYSTTFAGMRVKDMKLNLLGLPLLEQFSSVTVDAPRNQILFAYKRPFVPPANAASFPFTIEDGRMWITLSIGNQSVRAFFDTGCGSGLRLTSEILASLPKSVFASTYLKKRRAMGVGGVEMERVGVFKEATLDTLRMRPLEFDTSPGSRDVLLGWLPFSQNRMTIDFEKKRIWVEAPPKD